MFIVFRKKLEHIIDEEVKKNEKKIPGIQGSLFRENVSYELSEEYLRVTGMMQEQEQQQEAELAKQEQEVA